MKIPSHHASSYYRQKLVLCLTMKYSQPAKQKLPSSLLYCTYQMHLTCQNMTTQTHKCRTGYMEDLFCLLSPSFLFYLAKKKTKQKNPRRVRNKPRTDFLHRLTQKETCSTLHSSHSCCTTHCCASSSLMLLVSRSVCAHVAQRSSHS